MEFKLSDAELTIMQILWREGEMRATTIADIAKSEIGWEKNTSYTFLNRLIKKGAIVRNDPGFVCVAACDRDEMRTSEAHGMVDKLYDGSIGLFVQAFLSDKSITARERDKLQKLIDKHKE